MSFSYLLHIFINIYKTILITKYIKAANNAEIGNVITQVTFIRCAVFHFTPLMRLEEPTPNIDEDTTCVVESGKCSDDATKIVKAEDKSAARSEEHTSELQSRFDIVCRLLLEKKTKKYINKNI